MKSLHFLKRYLNLLLLELTAQYLIAIGKDIAIHVSQFVEDLLIQDPRFKIWKSRSGNQDLRWLVVITAW